jgi:D-threo-aldose 1-dehydrogenase
VPHQAAILETILDSNVRGRATVPYEPFEWMPVGRTDLRIMRLGFGSAPIGGLYAPVTDAEGEAVVRHAWEIGVRYFDVAPMYGFGEAEIRLGRVLREHPRDEFALSTKVGRLVVPGDTPGVEQAGQFVGTGPQRTAFDYSRDAILRSVDASLERMGLDRIDILFIHDPDDHWQAAISEAYPTLADLRSQGVVRAIGAGMNQAEMLTRFVREADIDVLLCAGRYTLLDQVALDELLPACIERRVSVVIGGIMNSGLLANPSPSSWFNYAPPPAEWLDRALRIKAVCDRHGVPLRAAAIQFPLAHPAVAAVAAGVRTAAHLDEYPAFMRLPIPAELWADLRAEGLVRDDAPTPA